MIGMVSKAIKWPTDQNWTEEKMGKYGQRLVEELGKIVGRMGESSASVAMES
jgi:hypothetical protein